MSITTLKSPEQPPKSTTQEQFFKEHASKQQESGLSRSAYCRKYQLNYDHFNYWYRKQKQAVQQLVPVKLNQSVEASSFNRIADRILCTLRLKNGGILQIHDKSILPLIFSMVN